MKKKIYIIIGVIMALFLGIMVIGSDESAPVTKEETSVKEDNITLGQEITIAEEVSAGSDLDAIPEGHKDYKKYIHDGGKYFLGKNKEYNFDLLMIEERIGDPSTVLTFIFEITNNTNEDAYFDQSLARLFIDDYEVQKGIDFLESLGMTSLENKEVYPLECNIPAGGRKNTIAFVTQVFADQINENSNIEFEMCGAIFKINPVHIINNAEEARKIEQEEQEQYEKEREETIYNATHPFHDTEAENYNLVEDRYDGTFVNDKGVTIIVGNNLITIQNTTDGRDVEETTIYSSIYKDIAQCYVVIDGQNEENELVFFEEGIYVNGPLGGSFFYKDGVQPDASSNVNGIDNPNITENESENGMTDFEYENWSGNYIRNAGPCSGLYICSIDETGILFAAGIGNSGYLSYRDLRDCLAEWTGDMTAVFNDEEGNRIELSFLTDNTLVVEEDRIENDDTLSISGLYEKSDNLNLNDYGFVLKESSTRAITENDLQNLGPIECKIARNEIYARHGRKFTDEQMQNYFDGCAWYKGDIPADSFSSDLLSEIERENVERISAYEDKMGYK